MRLPRDLSGSDLAKALQQLGYRVTRQTGSHLRLTTTEGGSEHENESRPQTRLDRDAGNGQGVTIGRLRPDVVFDWRFVSGGPSPRCRHHS